MLSIMLSQILSHLNQNGAMQLVTAVLLLLSIVFRSFLIYHLTNLLSQVLHIWLCYQYPVKHEEDGCTLPTCLYRWPNGQGDVAKFLQGGENSESWEKQFGQIYRIWSGMTPEVVVTRPEHIQAVFRDSDKHHKAVNNNSGYLMSQVLGQCVGLISGDRWRSVRAVAEKPFSRSASTGYVALVEQRTQRWFNELWTHNRLAQGLIDPAEDLKLLPFLVVAEIIYGELSPEMEGLLRELAPVREGLFKYVIRGGLTRFWWSKYLPTEANRALDDFRSRWIAFNQMARQRAVSLGISAPIVRMFEAAENGIVSHEQMYQTLDEMLYANLDVTLGGISWNLVFLAAHKEEQARLRGEVEEQKNAANMQNCTLEPYLLSSSSFLAACISESARLRPLAAFSVPQSVPTARTVGGYQFPAGTNFIVDSHALNIRNPYWGPDKAVYRPARFLERKATEARYNYWRFGFGPRQCMGKYVANLIIRSLLVHLVDNYDLSLLKTGEEWNRDPETWINHPQMQLKCESRKEKKLNA